MILLMSTVCDFQASVSKNCGLVSFLKKQPITFTFKRLHTRSGCSELVALKPNKNSIFLHQLKNSFDDCVSRFVRIEIKVTTVHFVYDHLYLSALFGRRGRLRYSLERMSGKIEKDDK